MSVTGTTLAQALYIETSAGVAVSYATKAAFLLAGWNISWQDSTGTALTTQPTWTLSAGSSGRHVIGFDNPSGQWTAKVVQLAGNVSNPIEFAGEGLVADAGTLYALLISSTGEVTTEIASSGELRIHDGDSIVADMVVSDTALAYLGAASLAACATLVAEIKLETVDSDQPATVSGLTETITSDTSGARLVRASLDAFPAALAVPDATDEVRARIDLKATYGARSVIVATMTLVVLWKAMS